MAERTLDEQNHLYDVVALLKASKAAFDREDDPDRDEAWRLVHVAQDIVEEVADRLDSVVPAASLETEHSGRAQVAIDAAAQTEALVRML